MGASQKLRTANIRNPLFNYCIKNPPFASLRMAKLHCLTSMLGLCGSPHKTNQQTQTFTKESVVFFWGSQTSNFLFLALSGLKRSWPGPIKTCSKKVRSSNGVQLEFLVRQNDGNFPAVFRVHLVFSNTLGKPPRCAGGKWWLVLAPFNKRNRWLIHCYWVRGSTQ